MINKLLRVAVLLLFTCACLGAQQAASDEPQQFIVLRSGHLVAPSEALTNADANCSIAGTGGAAIMQCHPAAVTVNSSYHYDTALIVDAKGTGYIIACRVSLVSNFWCKKADSGTALVGRFNNGRLAINDGQKFHDYQVLTSASVGPLPVIQPAPAPTKVKSQPVPPAAPQPAAAAPAAGKKPAETPQIPTADASAACMSPAAACVSFVSEPQGADIYVDGKFVGSTPSVLALAPGSHEIRIEAAKFAPWTRTLETTAGSKITIRATLEASAPRN